MMKFRHLFLGFLTALLALWTPNVRADEDQPRFVVPSMDMQESEGTWSYAAITPGNPCFTVYLWRYNDYKDDTYWKEGPTLTIDGKYSIKLDGFTGFSSDKYDWSYIDEKGIVQVYVHAHSSSFRVDQEDGAFFRAKFPEAEDFSYGGRDRYQGLDIYIYDNQPDQVHSLTAKGKVHVDWGTGKDVDMDVLNFDGGKTVYSGSTTFSVTDVGSSLIWTAPQKLTFTTGNLEDRTWGNYEVRFHAEGSYSTSHSFKSGQSSVNHSFSAPDYLSEEPMDIEYRYSGKYLNKYNLLFHTTKQYTPTTLPYPTELVASSYDAWNKSVTLKWNMGNLQTGNRDGYVYLRRDDKVIYSAEMSSAGWFKDEDVSYDEIYGYHLTFVPTGWPQDTDERQLSALTTACLERDFVLSDLTVGVNGNGYRVSWTASKYQGSQKAYYRVYRKVVTAGDEAITFSENDLLTEIEATSKTDYSHQDNDVNTTDTYAYMVSIHAQEQDYQTPAATPSDHLGGSTLTSFSATRGTYTDHVDLKWTAFVQGNDRMVYVIKRHTIDNSGVDQYTAANAYIVLDTLKDDATTKHTSFTDTKMLCGYYYMYKIEGLVNGSKTSYTTMLCDGYARSTGTVTGNVTFNSAGRTVGVEGARVNFEAEGSDNLRRSLHCASDSTGILWRQDNVKLSNYFDQRSFSIQMYVRPDGGQSGAPCLMDMPGTLRLSLCDETADGYRVAATVGGQTYTSSHRLRADQFTHLTFTYDGKNCGQLMLVDTIDVVMTDTLFTDATIRWQPTAGYEGNVGVCMEATRGNTLHGYVDEVRFFKRQLSAADVLQNYNRLLGGSEKGLIAYWPMDENIENIFRAYDTSSTDGKPNENHALIIGAQRSTTFTPNNDQLSLHAVTDTLGYYALSGITFAGEGTSYRIIPTKGVHEFDPGKRTIFVNGESLSFQQMDFTDKSSFNVKGVVYYENTLYPVKGCRFLVDGVVVKDKQEQEVLTNEDGEFTIPVSIGQHYITIEKEGHVFANNGRWPETGLVNINDSVSGLTFTDITKAIVAGRIVGGSVEQGKPLGVRQSLGNIGQATLTLLTSADVKDAKKMNVLYDKENGIYYENTDTLPVAPANPELVRSKAYVGAYQGLQADANVKTITIQTDSATGEFAVLLPPVPYYITTTVNNNTEATTALGGKGSQLLDASNVLHTDTTRCDVIQKDSTVQHLEFVYNVSFQPSYNAVPTISVRQTDNDLGAFGEPKVPAGELNDTVSTYHIDTETGLLVYDYGYPIFTKGNFYTLEISSYERYYNYDVDAVHPAVYDQPSVAGLLSIVNPMTLDGDTLDAVPLNEEGKYTYTFQALEPNVVEPYTQPVGFYLTIGDNVTPWRWDNGGEDLTALQAVVFSAKLTGKAYVTAAPDVITQIIRDPFGSHSKMSWAKGSTFQVSFHRDIKYSYAAESGREVSKGAGTQQATGAPGLYIYSKMAVVGYHTAGISGGLTLGNDETMSWKLTTHEEFSTSAEKAYDGADGDLFIGSSTSLTYGDGLEVMLVNDQHGGYNVGTKNVIVTGTNFTGDFCYSQHYIENQLIPEYEKLRRERMTLVSEEELQRYRESFKNTTDSIIYMTSLSPDDPRFGSHNVDSLYWGGDTITWREDGHAYWGSSYSVFLPEDSTKVKDTDWDAIAELTSQIEDWREKLRQNEEMKVKAINNPGLWLRKTYSFDSASDAITYTSDREWNTSIGWTIQGDVGYFRKYKLGTEQTAAWQQGYRQGTFEWNIKTDRMLNPSISYGQSREYTMTLADDVMDNYHTVERYTAPDFNGWIYRQTGGATSQNYEPELRTKYYQPGTVISEGTVQVEVPHIYCPEPVKTNQVAKTGATFDLELTNATTASLTPGTYTNWGLQIVNDKYATMAAVTMNGQPVPNNIYEFALEAGDTVRVKLNVQPADNSIIHIDSLHVCLFSDGQWSLSDDLWLAAHFMPEAEGIQLLANRTTVNTATDSTLTLTAKGYNTDSSILNAVRMQQRKVGTPEWTTLHSWVNGTPHGDTESELTAEVIMLIDMHNRIAYPDATYEFRAVTDCTVGGEQVMGTSAVVTVIKDVTLPQPMSLPEPSDGVLGVGDDISVTFNEDIYSKSLSKDDNFIIQSVLNADSIAHEVALRLDGTAAPAATSQTGLTLGNTSFTVCTWLKHTGNAGTILRHGDGADALRINIEEDGRLTVYLTGEDGKARAYTSDVAIPQDIWVYIGVTYDVDAGTLTAHYASGDDEKTLMAAVNVGSHATSQGKLSLGENLVGAMHELSLYSTALTWSTIQLQMYTGKSCTTPALIGYWRLDEGHGTESEDHARSRHMQIASASGWYMENENIALQLDGTTYAALPLGNIAAASDESYLLEMWVRCADTAAGQVFSLDHGQKLDLNIVEGKLQLVVDGAAYNASRPVFNANEWHHVAFNVLRGTSARANLIVDGTSALTVSTEAVPALAGAYIYLGHDLKGAIDEVRLWHGTNTQEAVAERMYYRVDGKATSGLVGYYPMEYSYYDDYHQRIFEFSPINRAAEATEATTLKAVVQTEEAATQESTFASTTDAPGLKTAPHKSNLDFHFVADERTVAITLDHSAAAIEGCTISTTLRNYYDLNTNVGAPVTWTFDVKQNPLLWQKAEVNETVGVGEKGTFTVTLTNTGVKDQRWAMTELPSWLKASPASGTVPAHGTLDVTFSVAAGNAIGKYFTTVSARTTDRDLDTPLDICLTVEGERPDWTPASYPMSMTIIGQIKIDGVVSTDPADMVGAFISNGGVQECVGVGQPIYNASTDAYYVWMSVVGNSSMKGSIVSFQLYDASTGITYPLVITTPVVKFEIDGKMGNWDEPVVWQNDDKLMQSIELMDGYSSISFYLDPDTKDQHIFDMLGDDIQELIVLKDSTLTHVNGTWSADYEPILPGQMMKVKLARPATLNVIGNAVKPENWKQKIFEGSNWVGVPTQAAMTIDEAFAGITPEEGDQVKLEGVFSIFTNGHWEGGVEAILPGRGYVYMSVSEKADSLVFPATSQHDINEFQTARTGVAANFKYLKSMIAICTVRDLDGSNPAEALIEAYDSDGELRGRSFANVRDSIYLLVVSGPKEGEAIVLNAQLPDGRTFTHLLPQGFQHNGQLGTLREPFVINALADGIGSLALSAGSMAVYTTSGILVYQGAAASFDRHRLPAGEVLIVVERTHDGQTKVYKLKK